MKKTNLKCISHVAIYFVQKVFGGGEEGGWFFEAGELASKVHTYISDEEYDPDNDQWGDEKLYTLRKRLQRWLDYHCEENKCELSSVLSEGKYVAQIYRGEEYPPEHYPESKPTYS